jgi:hypothetical protein
MNIYIFYIVSQGAICDQASAAAAADIVSKAAAVSDLVSRLMVELIIL